jgi:endo-1,4-beta-xylanase
MLNRRDFILKLSAILAANIAHQHFSLIDVLAKEQEIYNFDNRFAADGNIALKSRAARRGLLFGAASMKTPLYNKEKYAAKFVEECNILVAENELKWSNLRHTPYEFNFQPGDWLLNFARKNGLLFRGHTLVWHEALPDWFRHVVNKKNAEKYLHHHIREVVGHYAGKMHSWDVVNEVVSPWDGRPDGLANTIWLKLLGPSYIDMAFKAAAAADPKALLVLNQNYLEYDATKWAGFRTATLNLLKRQKSSGTPIHALGIQAHLSSDEGKFDPRKFRAFLKDVASLDLKIMITELDVKDKNLPYDKVTRDILIAGMYEEFLSVALDEPAVIAVMTWGLSDKYSWLADRPRDDRSAVRPLPLDEKCNRKLAWNAIARAFDRAPQR